MPWAIHSFEMTTEVCCSDGKHRGTYPNNANVKITIANNTNALIGSSSCFTMFLCFLFIV